MVRFRHRPIIGFFVLSASFVLVACAGESAPAGPGSTDMDSERRVSSAIAHSCQKAVQSEDSESDPFEDISPAQLMDARSYAQDFDVELGEAVVRLSGQGVIGRLGSEIQTLESDTYAGHWIQHEPNTVWSSLSPGMVAALSARTLKAIPCLT